MGRVMSPDSTPTEVFPDVEPDPDAVLAEFGVDSPADLEGDGAHDPIPDDAAVDDTTATELFDDLQTVTPADADTAADPDPTDRSDAAGGVAGPAAALAFEFVGDPDVVVRDDGDVIDATATELSAVTATGSSEDASADTDNGSDAASRGSVTASSGRGEATDTGDADGAGSDSTSALTVRAGTDLELVGPEPTPTRVGNDAFGDTGAR
ncbi:hypothetical protein C488_18850 [Natrinema pellirubrum DSM 15624]|uniref:Uncharacterized protein n=1 Tax=Natrinema pellirubrum (strain DSM 15624 / CIP 106293 / JCM 10476 / NCIMB 786 / 157) TaxID=797303 RepID=L0JGH6_NATP1|nr:hypothetical protein [Natrinema pellirubrum]AGB29958.1 hypothetical protein Natpe_0007 [Natrinema pellirubrum DSM 15624]ELY70502.1 hypothetical protein C488_18850 [Natrinema pellirubrum DSM 15624]